VTALATITPRLRKLLLMLSSGQPGEVVAAANAIDRALKTAGRDWRDLARGLLSAPQTKPQQKTNDVDTHWRITWRFCCENKHLLRQRECEFVNSLEHWRKPTEKQLTWLSAIAARLRQS